MKYYLTKEWFYDILYPLTLGRGTKVCEEADRAEEEILSKRVGELYDKGKSAFVAARCERSSVAG